MEVAINQMQENLSEWIDRAEKGEYVTILRQGHPVARLVPVLLISAPWRVEIPDDPDLYRGIDLDAPTLEEI